MNRLCLAAPLTLLLVAASPAPAAPEAAPHTGFRHCDHCPEMVVVPAGLVPAGDPLEYEDMEEGSRPLIRVERPFAIGRYEVTQAQWQAVMGSNPSAFQGLERPVETVTWRDAQEYLRRLQAHTGKAYRLPSEAEWEYAARAGSAASFGFGEDLGQLGRHAWYQVNADGESLTPVNFNNNLGLRVALSLD
jgi:formylglycine-generating enzyme required for sulfatase activity